MPRWWNGRHAGLRSQCLVRESSSLSWGTKIGVLAELVEGTFLLRRQAGKNLLHWFESNTLRQMTT